MPLLAALLGLVSAAADAQPPFDPSKIDAPQQFYTDGFKIDTWKQDEALGQMVTLWFGRNPEASVSYRPMIAVRRDNNPGKILYYDPISRRFVGRYDMALGKYSLLAPEHRLGRLEDIQEEWFPPPGEKPTIGELFDPPEDGLPSQEQLMMPPVTMMFPRLENSTWKGFYTDIGGNRRRKMNLTFDGDRGSYEAPDVGLRGNLRNVQYETQENGLVIRGNWAAGSSGGFEFRIMMSDLNEFQGEYWVGNNRRQLFLWDGKRTSR
jgi:hypothetical protein